MLRNIDIDLVYQPFIDQPPIPTQELQKRAISGDGPTIETWRNTWIDNYRATKERFGSLFENSFGQLRGINKHKPAIVIGSGPSLKYQIDALKKNSDGGVLAISCLHNFGLFEDHGFHADYYLTLDSGKIVIPDVFEGRDMHPDYYWEKTKDCTLLAYAGTDPELFDKWQGDVYLFNCLIPDMGIREELAKIERFPHYISSGGNALGACMYTAKAVMGSGEIIYVGADFCFGYDNQFHSYKTHYDTPGQCVYWPDVYGNMRKTWPSYLNFKYWFDKVALTVPGRWVSCSEGIMGAYKEGNIRAFQYMQLKDALLSYGMADRFFLESKDAKTHKTVEKIEILLDDMYGKPDFQHDLTLF